MWYNNFSCSLIIKQFANGYHSAIKRILKVPKWESNHLVCEATGLVTFDHYINLIQVVFTQRLFKSPLLFIQKLKPFLLYNSCSLKYVNRTFKTKYNVYDILENDIDALKARIFYVHDEYVELFV